MFFKKVVFLSLKISKKVFAVNYFTVTYRILQLILFVLYDSSQLFEILLLCMLTDHKDDRNFHLGHTSRYTELWLSVFHTAHDSRHHQVQEAQPMADINVLSVNKFH